MAFYARIETPANGSTQDFAVPFPYLLQAHVKVYLVLTGQAEQDADLQTVGAAYTFTSASLIHFPTAPASGHTVIIKRRTPSGTMEKVIPSGTIASVDLNTDYTQLLFLLQEDVDDAIARDLRVGGLSASVTALTNLVESLLAGLTPPGLPSTATLTTFATLQALLKANLSLGTTVSVLGALTVGDGGAGTFRWDPTSTATADAGTVLASGEGGNGRWSRVIPGEAVHLEWWGVDRTGSTDCSAAASAWVDYGLAHGLECRVGAGLFLLNSTIQKNVSAKRFSMVGAGMEATEFFRGPGTVSADFQSMFSWQCAAGALCNFDIRNLALNFNCLNNVTPGGSLDSNFTWQHNICMDWHPLGVDACDTIHCQNIRIRFPISDGLSIRGGASTGMDVRNAIFDHIVNTDWDISAKRPRVRGDITMATLLGNMWISNCILPRLHFEPGVPIPAGSIANFWVNDCTVGQYLGHMGTSVGQTDIFKVNIRETDFHFGMIWGCCATLFENCTMVLNATVADPLTLRQTLGSTTMRGCDIIVPASFVGTPPTGGSTNVLFVSDAGGITIERCTLTIDPAATVLPEFFVQSNIQDTRGLVIRGFRMIGCRSMRLTIAVQTIEVTDVVSDWDGTTGGVYPGGFIMSIFSSTAGFDSNVTLERIRFNNPNGGGKLFTGCAAALTAGGSVKSVIIRDCVVAPGNVFDFTSSSYGAQSISHLASPWNPSPTGTPSWQVTSFAQDEQGEASPTAGAYLRGQRVMKVGAAASASPGWVCVVTGVATGGNTATNFKALAALAA